jgi:hypothetical protein
MWKHPDYGTLLTCLENLTFITPEGLEIPIDQKGWDHSSTPWAKYSGQGLELASTETRKPVQHERGLLRFVGRIAIVKIEPCGSPSTRWLGYLRIIHNDAWIGTLFILDNDDGDFLLDQTSCDVLEVASASTWVHCLDRDFLGDLWMPVFDPEDSNLPEDDPQIFDISFFHQTRETHAASLREKGIDPRGWPQNHAKINTSQVMCIQRKGGSAHRVALGIVLQGFLDWRSKEEIYLA